MWSDTWAIVLTAAIIFLLLSVEMGRRWTRLSSATLATLLAWSYFVRPTNSVAIIAITIYVVAFQRRFLLSYALTGVAWFVLLVIYSWHNFGLLLPYYFRANRLHFGQYWEALAGNLISPSRGLLIFVPALFFVGYLLLRYWRELPFKRLAVLTLVIAVGHLLTVAAFVPWHGGGCYGARYSTGLAPWFTLLAVIGCASAVGPRRVSGQKSKDNDRRRSSARLKYFHQCAGRCLLRNISVERLTG